MPAVTIVYWRDIPAQIIVGKGRRGSKAPLPERFEQAIDRCAMKVGAKDDDAYLADWRKAAPFEVEGEPDEIAAAQADLLDRTYDQDRLKTLIANDGWESGKAA
ncbi:MULTISPECIES: virulence factor [Paracoccaceae]|uniref:virulence factor n=1 Tax=Rhodobacterales TaxID=204455 RepID=UPI001AFE926C|nr:virulence factor [Boseongicola sp. H5]MBO6603816.1 virulence factor [Roseicyclus sp.]MBO6921325.1 virulence factor [Roseicyclus sp.]